MTLAVRHEANGSGVATFFGWQLWMAGAVVDRECARIPQDVAEAGWCGARGARLGARLVLEPAPPSSLLARLATLKAIDEPWPQIVDRPPDDVEL